MLCSRASRGVRVKLLDGFPSQRDLWSEGWEVPRQPGEEQNCLLDLHHVLFEAQSCKVKWPEPWGRRRAGRVLLERASLQVCSKPRLDFQQTEVGFELCWRMCNKQNVIIHKVETA